MRAFSTAMTASLAISGFLALYVIQAVLLIGVGLPLRLALGYGLALPLMALPIWGIVLIAPRLKGLANGLYFLWAMVFVIDTLGLAYTMIRYGVPTDSPGIVEAMANASLREITEYAKDSIPLIAACLIVIPALAWIVSMPVRFVSRRIADRGLSSKTGIAIATLFLVILPFGLHANPVVSRADPVTRWVDLFHRYAAQEAGRKELIALRARATGRIAELAPHVTGLSANTMVLVIGESSNRTDWSLYGYPRKTTPELDGMRDQLVVLKDAISSYGSTLIEIIRMLTPSHLGDDDQRWRHEPDVMALAKAAGYKVFWLSNQNDEFINTVFASQANVFTLVNHGQGRREDISLDERLLPEFDKALADKAPLKLIILHTLGSHQHYELRYPDSFDKFSGLDDSVEKSMADKWFFVRKTRSFYDNSILYTDHILAETIKRLKASQTPQRSLVFLSDHAQDVGHLTALWGHQFRLESGFTVPMFLWSDTRHDLYANKAVIEKRPYQTDRLDASILSLLAIKTKDDHPEDDVFGPEWMARERTIDGRLYVPGKSHMTLPKDPNSWF